jgi:hypothetical protein
VRERRAGGAGGRGVREGHAGGACGRACGRRSLRRGVRSRVAGRPGGGRFGRVLWPRPEAPLTHPPTHPPGHAGGRHHASQAQARQATPSSSTPLVHLPHSHHPGIRDQPRQHQQQRKDCFTSSPNCARVGEQSHAHTRPSSQLPRGSSDPPTYPPPGHAGGRHHATQAQARQVQGLWLVVKRPAPPACVWFGGGGGTPGGGGGGRGLGGAAARRSPFRRCPRPPRP